MSIDTKSIFTKKIPAGGKWSEKICRGKEVTFTALGEGVNVSILLYNADDTSERYNMSDTLKAQHTSHLTKGHVLMSDNGRVLASFVEDSLSWHDPISGYITRQMVEEKYGYTTYQESRNGWYRNGKDNILVELSRNGLTARDLSPVVNLFSKVYCDKEGKMHFVTGHAKKGDTVTLRTEMDVILILSNTPNSMDTSSTYSTAPIEITIKEAKPLKDDDVCLNYSPENRRAFENTWDYVLLTKGGMN